MKRAKGMEKKGYTYSYDMLGEAARTDERRAALSPELFAARSPPSPRPARTRTSATIPASRSSSRRCIRATRWRSTRPGDGRTGAAPALARASCAIQRGHGPQHRRRGGRPPGALARRDRGGAVGTRRCAAGTASASWCRPMASARAPCSTGSTTSRHALDRRIMVRLVKGAYWDTEIKRAQVAGVDGFPVFTSQARDGCQLHRQRAQAPGHDRPDLSAIRHA